MVVASQLPSLLVQRQKGTQTPIGMKYLIETDRALYMSKGGGRNMVTIKSNEE